MTDSLEEGESHATADDECVDLFKQVVDDTELVVKLSAAQHCNERTIRVFERPPMTESSLPDQIAADSTGTGNFVHALGGSVHGVRSRMRR